MILALALFLTTGYAVAEKDADTKTYTLSLLTEKIEKLERTEIVISGTIIGVCKSGCKMWIADGEYKEGDAYALVRAKDDAFKFDTKASGKVVVLHGFAVAKYMDYCAESGEEQEGAMKKCETPVKTADEETEKEKTAEKKAEKDNTEKRELKDVTFFATKVEYKWTLFFSKAAR
jgi:hypothetical protein